MGNDRVSWFYLQRSGNLQRRRRDLLVQIDIHFGRQRRRHCSWQRRSGSRGLILDSDRSGLSCGRSGEFRLLLLNNLNLESCRSYPLFIPRSEMSTKFICPRPSVSFQEEIESEIVPTHTNPLLSLFHHTPNTLAFLSWLS